MDASDSADLRTRCLPWSWIALWGVVATCLRAVHLGDQPLWYDEIASLYRASARDLPTLVSRLAGDVQAPLYDLLMWPLVAVAGDGAFVSRVPALVASVLLVPAAAALALRLWRTSSAAVFAAAWVAVDPYLVRYGVEGRPYALLALLVVAACTAAHRFRDSGGRRSGWWLALLGAALMWLHPYGVTAWAGLVLWLLAQGRALRHVPGRVATVLLVPLLALVAWLPLSLHQLATHSMSGIYRGLDATQAKALLDLVGLAAPRGALEPESWAVLVGRWIAPALALTGWLWLRAGREPAAGEPAPPTGAGGWGVAALAGAALLLAASWLVPLELLASVASDLAKGGRPLDAENLAFLERLRIASRGAALGLLAAGALALSSARWAPRWRGRLSAAWLPVCVVVVPLLVAAALAAAGKPTLAPRNLIFAAPLTACLSAGVVTRVPARMALVVTLLLGLQAAWGIGAVDGFHRRRPWPEIAAAVDASRAEPLAHPPWTARCLEYHGRRPWGSVFGTRDPVEARAWAADKQRVALVTSYVELDDPAAVRASLAEGRRPGPVTRFPGLTCEVFQRP